MVYIPLKEQVFKERNKNEELKAENAKLSADLDYVAMMCDVELENGGHDDEI